MPKASQSPLITRKPLNTPSPPHTTTPRPRCTGSFPPPRTRPRAMAQRSRRLRACVLSRRERRRQHCPSLGFSSWRSWAWAFGPGPCAPFFWSSVPIGSEALNPGRRRTWTGSGRLFALRLSRVAMTRGSTRWRRRRRAWRGLGAGGCSCWFVWRRRMCWGIGVGCIMICWVGVAGWVWSRLTRPKTKIMCFIWMIWMVNMQRTLSDGWQLSSIETCLLWFDCCMVCNFYIYAHRKIHTYNIFIVHRCLYLCLLEGQLNMLL